MMQSIDIPLILQVEMRMLSIEISKISFNLMLMKMPGKRLEK